MSKEGETVEQQGSPAGDGDSVSPTTPQKQERASDDRSAEQKIRGGSQKAKEAMQKSFGSPAMQKACQWLAFAGAITLVVGQGSKDFWYYGDSAGSVFRFLFFLFVAVLICISPFHVGVIENFSKEFVGCTYYPIGQGALLLCLGGYIYPWFGSNMPDYSIVYSVFGLATLVLGALVLLCGLFGGNGN